jgi:CheY-like chemotaxis protein
MKVKQAVRDVPQPQGALLGVHRAPSGIDPNLAGRKILVADDEEGIRQTISDVLISCGCDVETARDGDEALCMLGTRPYDLVFSDIRMPGKNGYEVFAACREQNPACPIILMTGFGYDPNHSIIRARQEGLSAVLFKPFKVEQLLNEVRGALASTPVKR